MFINLSGAKVFLSTPSVWLKPLYQLDEGPFFRVCVCPSVPAEGHGQNHWKRKHFYINYKPIWGERGYTLYLVPNPHAIVFTLSSPLAAHTYACIGSSAVGSRLIDIDAPTGKVRTECSHSEADKDLA